MTWVVRKSVFTGDSTSHVSSFPRQQPCSSLIPTEDIDLNEMTLLTQQEGVLDQWGQIKCMIQTKKRNESSQAARGTQKL